MNKIERLRSPWARVGGLIIVAVVIAVGLLVGLRGDPASTASLDGAASASMAEQALSLAQTTPRLSAQLATAGYRLDPDGPTREALFEVAADNSTVSRIIDAGQPVGVLAEDPNGVYLYAGTSDGTLATWDMSTGDRLAAIRLASPLQDLTVNPEGSTLAGIDQSGNLIVWGTSGGTISEKITIPAPVSVTTGPVQAITCGFYDDGRRLFVLYSDGQTYAFDARSGSPLGRSAIPTSSVITAASGVSNAGGAPASAVVYAADSAGGLLAIKLGSLQWSVALSSPDLPQNVTSVGIGPGAPGTIEISGNSTVSLWSLKTGQETWAYPVGALTAGFYGGSSELAILTTAGVSFVPAPGPDGTEAALGDTGQAVEAGQSYGGAAQAFAVPTGDGTFVALGSADGSISIVDPTKDSVQLPPAPASTVLAFDGRGNLILSDYQNSANRTAGLYRMNPENGYASGSYTESVSYNPASSWWPGGEEFYANDATVGGGLLMVAGQNPGGQGVVLVWNEATGRPVRELVLHGKPALAVNVRYVPGRHLVVASDINGQVDAWSTLNWRQVMQMSVAGTFAGIEVSPDGDSVVAPVEFGGIAAPPGEQTGRLAVINLGTHVMHEQALPGPFYQAAYAPDGSRVALAGQDDTIKFVSPSGEPLAGSPSIQLPGIPVELAYSPDGQFLAVTLADGYTLVYDAATGELALPPLSGGTAAGGSDVAWSPDGSVLAVGTGQSAGQYEESVDVQLWEMNPNAWERQDCALAAGNLTAAEWREYVGNGVTYKKACATGNRAADPVQTSDLRQGNGAATALPRGVCDSEPGFEVRNERATIQVSAFGRTHVEELGKATYGELTPSGPEVAALTQLTCATAA